jgi:hypothetical protein
MGDRLWPVSIALGLTLVVAVNGAFAWLALRHAPIVEPSYTESTHR